MFLTSLHRFQPRPLLLLKNHALNPRRNTTRTYEYMQRAPTSEKQISTPLFYTLILFPTPRENTAKKARTNDKGREREREAKGGRRFLSSPVCFWSVCLPHLRNPSLPLKNPPQCLRGFAASAHRSPSLPQPGACRTPRTHFRYDGCPFPNAGTPRTRVTATRNA